MEVAFNIEWLAHKGRRVSASLNLMDYLDNYDEMFAKPHETNNTVISEVSSTCHSRKFPDSCHSRSFLAGIQECKNMDARLGISGMTKVLMGTAPH